MTETITEQQKEMYEQYMQMRNAFNAFQGHLEKLAKSKTAFSEGTQIIVIGALSDVLQDCEPLYQMERDMLEAFGVDDLYEVETLIYNWSCYCGK